jgi:hypothetical protein
MDMVMTKKCGLAALIWWTELRALAAPLTVVTVGAPAQRACGVNQGGAARIAGNRGDQPFSSSKRHLSRQLGMNRSPANDVVANTLSG